MSGAGERRRGREAALQLLYQIEFTGDGSRGVREQYWSDRDEAEADPASRELAERIVAGVEAGRTTLDERIETAADNWQIDRLSRLDLNLLRMSVWELLEAPEVPAEVVMDEAVEIARRYGGDGSASFVNGVLDRIARAEGRLGAG